MTRDCVRGGKDDDDDDEGDEPGRADGDGDGDDGWSKRSDAGP